MRLLFFDSSKTSLPNSFFDIAADYDIIVIAKAIEYDRTIRGMSVINRKLERVPELMKEEGMSLTFVPKDWTPVNKKFGIFTKTKEDSWWASITVRNGDTVFQIITCELECKSIHVKASQFAELTNVKEKEAQSFIACDTGIMYYNDSRFQCPEGFKDAWSIAGSMNNQFTRLESRQDRIWFSGTRCMSYELIDLRRNNTALGVEFI